MAQKDKPPQLTMLEAKGIFARDCFRFQDQPEVYYCITRNKRFVGLNGEEMPLSEDDIWERYDIIEKISRAAFAQAQSEYRDRLWQARGQPNTLELASLAPAFLDAYCNHYEDRKWQAVCRVYWIYPWKPCSPMRQVLTGTGKEHTSKCTVIWYWQKLPRLPAKRCFSNAWSIGILMGRVFFFPG